MVSVIRGQYSSSLFLRVQGIPKSHISVNTGIGPTNTVAETMDMMLNTEAIGNRVYSLVIIVFLAK